MFFWSYAGQLVNLWACGQTGMKLTDFIGPEQIILTLEAATKKEVLEELVRPLTLQAKLKNPRQAVKILLEREALSSTGIGQGVAIPHARLEGLENLSLVLGLSPAGVNFNAQDGQKTHIFFLLLAPPAAGNLYLQVLARVSRLLKQGNFCRALINHPQNQEEVWRLLAEKE